MSFDVRFYRTEDGKCPVEDFLDSLDAKTAQKVTWVLRLIEDLDKIPDKYFKKLSGTEGIWETRILASVGYLRLLGFIDNRNFWLTNGIIKKTDKISPGDIEKAERCKKEHFGRR